MSGFTFWLLCAQACLIQAAFGCGCDPGVSSINYRNAGNIGCGNFGSPAGYGGKGFADISITGKFDVYGTTCVSGQIPVLGQVSFGGPVQAVGAGVTYGSCGSSCGCGCQKY